ncbi:hypothetical protein MBAV_003207 [Candidatus Magnetobacterium bavaricum]|uniref:Uncharacterized protein n=1 Tax=Candidatus Magnetobacterium bavaricum TaxID=29290 RepID=A0A0F3GRS2_9BACT|nr:hypothetical protein MBAV_003207 [Candidatus Magnetobacterium bavaricum]
MVLSRPLNNDLTGTSWHFFFSISIAHCFHITLGMLHYRIFPYYFKMAPGPLH